GLRLGASEDTVVTSAVALVAFLLVATLAAALASLLFTHAGSAWDNAKKYIETGAHGGRYVLDAAGPAQGARRDAGAGQHLDPSHRARSTSRKNSPGPRGEI